MLFDTSFFIHLSGRSGRRRRSAALDFLAAHPDLPLYTSRVCWAELAEGVASPVIINELLADYSIIEIDEEVAWQTSRVARLLKRGGRHIGDNDCWIAGSETSPLWPPSWTPLTVCAASSTDVSNSVRSM